MGVGLQGLDFLLDCSPEECRREYNGIGPEFLPEDVREAITRYLEKFEPAALIHDMRFSVSDGTAASFNYANMEFYANCKMLANFWYPWWNWRRYRARCLAGMMYDAVSGDAGWKAWRDAYMNKLSGNSAGETKEST